ncbi:hypothetical protein [uncultured Roseovarius sp.]|uniref:hypothetical protein n=1 Tax=uncultured Roseovarius sp. TaxID=293344 RepID=UPI00262FDCC7|nr:hypothetical protein [uncultured Roseovarius sp.]
MYQWIKTASATFAGGAVALGLLAIPTYLWLPREFDRLDSRLIAVEENQKTIITQAQESLQISKSISESIEASLSDVDGNKKMIGYLAASFDKEKSVLITLLRENLPTEMVNSWEAEGKFEFLGASMINGDGYLFIDKSMLGSFTLQEQDILIRLGSNDGIQLVYWDKSLFPGYSAFQESKE